MPSRARIAQVREVPSQLAAQSEHEACAENSSRPTGDSSQALARGNQIDFGFSSSTTAICIDADVGGIVMYPKDDASSSSRSASGSGSGDSQLDGWPGNPFHILRDALPHIHPSAIVQALEYHGWRNAGEGNPNAARVDIEVVRNYLLAAEYERQMNGRGEWHDYAREERVDEYRYALASGRSDGERNQKGGESANSSRRPKGVTHSLTGPCPLLRVNRSPRRNTSPSGYPASAAPEEEPNRWISDMSLASYLSSLLPPYQDTHFMSYFRKYETRYDAALACLDAIASQRTPDTFGGKDEHVFASMVVNLRQLTPAQPSLIRLALRATRQQQLGRRLSSGLNPDAALPLIELLHKLYLEARDKRPATVGGMGHQPNFGHPTSSPTFPASPESSLSLSMSSLSLSSPSRHMSHGEPGSGHPLSPQHMMTPISHGRYDSGYDRTSGDRNEWQQVQPSGRRRRTDSQNESMWVPPPEKARREDERRPDELFRAAERAWSAGGKRDKPFRGEMAAAYAEMGRQRLEEIKEKELDEARRMIMARRAKSSDPLTIDLHGTTVAEARVISGEILESEGASPSKPLFFMTGRGRHSEGGRPVLKPALRKAMKQDGWDVDEYEIGLRVNGRLGDPGGSGRR